MPLGAPSSSQWLALPGLATRALSLWLNHTIPQARAHAQGLPGMGHLISRALNSAWCSEWMLRPPLSSPLMRESRPRTDRLKRDHQTSLCHGDLSHLLPLLKARPLGAQEGSLLVTFSVCEVVGNCSEDPRAACATHTVSSVPTWHPPWGDGAANSGFGHRWMLSGTD